MRHWWIVLLVVLVACIGLAMVWKRIIDSTIDPNLEETAEQATVRRYRTALGVGAVFLIGALVLVWTYCPKGTQKVVVGTMAGKRDRDYDSEFAYEEEEEEIPAVRYPTKESDTEAFVTLVTENIDKFPEDWQWESISVNPYITMELVNRYPDKPWVYFRMVTNPAISVKDAASLLVEKLGFTTEDRWHRLKYNPNFTLDDFTEYILPYSRYGDSEGELLGMPNITIPKYYEYMRRHLGPDTNIIISEHRASEHASSNPNVTVQDFIDHPALFDREYASSNPSIPFRDIVKNRKLLDWDWKRISGNPSIDINFVIAHPELGWDRLLLAQNPAVTLENWQSWGMFNSITELARNPNLTIEAVKSLPVEAWNWGHVSESPGISIETKLANNTLPWDWDVVAVVAKYSDILKTKVYQREDWDWEQFQYREFLDFSEWHEYVRQRDLAPLAHRQALKPVADQIQFLPASPTSKYPIRKIDRGAAYERLKRLADKSLGGELQTKRQRTDEEHELDQRERYFAIHGYDEEEFPFQEEYEEPVDEDEETMPVFQGGGSNPPKIMGMKE